MALAKFYEDIVEARRENGAAIVFEYQHPQENAKRVAHVETPIEPAPYRLTARDRIALIIFVLKLESDPERISPELLQQTHDWSSAHFTELARRSPEALARVAMAHRDQTIKLRTPEPSSRAVTPRKPFVVETPEPSFRAITPRKPVFVEIRKRRPDVLHLRSYAECY
jgi:hypothetical protein